MAIHCSTFNDFVKRTTNIVASTSNYTCIYWFNASVIKTASPGNYNVGFLTIDNPNVYQFYAGSFFDSTTNHWEVGNGVTFPDISGSVFSANIWYPVAYVRSGNVHSYYVSGIFIGNITQNITAGTFGENLLGSDTFAGGDISFYNFREWNTNLSFTQINAEINSPLAIVHTANLVTFTPLISDLLDISGNGNDWTAVGTPTFVADPSLPTNTTALSAITIPSLPYTTTQNPKFDSYTFSLWYKYIAASTDNIIGFFGLGDLTTYRPNTFIFSPDSITRYLGGVVGLNVPIQLPVTSGVTYYFQIVPNNGNPAGTLNISSYAHSGAGIPVGSIAINDDTDGFPLAITSSSIDSVLKFIQNFPAGESGAILPDGTLLVEDATPNNCKLYDGGYNLIGIVALGNVKFIGYDALGSQFLVLWKNGSNHYVVNFVSKAGVIGGTTYDLGTSSVTNCVADATYLYYQLTGDTTIRRWTIATNLVAADLVAAIVGSGPNKDIIILSDGTIIASYIKNPGNSIKRYDNTGSLLNTYDPIDTGSPDDRMAPDSTSGYFYYWSQHSTNPTVFFHIKASDGTTTSKNQTIFEDGEYGGAPTLTPTALFGASFSCPFWVTRTGATIIIGKASVPVNSQMFTVNVTGPVNQTFLIGFDGTESLSVIPGTYSIVEVANADYQPQYNVSTGAPNTAIVISNGQLIDLVIVNQLSAKYGGLYQLVPSKTNDTLRNQDGSTTQKMINWFYELFTDRDK